MGKDRIRARPTASGTLGGAVKPTQSVAGRSPRRWLILLGVLLSALTLSGVAASPAMAEDGSTSAASEEEEFEYFFTGNVTFEDEPLEGVRITVEGGGFEAETETDVEGKWTLGVPEKEEYELTLDEDTLPEGVVVEEGQSTVTAEFGLTNRKAVNFFLGEGTRVTTDIGAFESELALPLATARESIVRRIG